jgi:hypothetical protein
VLAARQIGVPDRVHVVRARGVEAEVVALAGERRDAAGAAVDRLVVGLEQAGAARQLGADPGEVARLALRLDRRLAQHHAACGPELLDELGAADLDHLQGFEVGGLGQQQVGEEVGLVHRVGEGHGEGEGGDRLHQAGRVPERDRRVGAVDEPDVGQGRLGHVEVARHLALEHPRQLGGAERLAPRRVADDRHQGAVGVAPGGLGDPVLLVGGVEFLRHEAVLAGGDAEVAVVVRAVESYRGAEGAARHLERAHQGGEHRARPAALEGAPAVVNRLAERDRDRAQRQGGAVHLDGGADLRVLEVLAGDAADGGAGTSQMPSAHSGVYLRMCSTSIVWAGVPSTSASGWRASSASTVTAAATRKRPSSAGSTPGVSKGTARPRRDPTPAA